MYETCVGPATAGGLGLVWHIIAKSTRTTLCEHPLAHTPHPAPQPRTHRWNSIAHRVWPPFRCVMQARPQ